MQRAAGSAVLALSGGLLAACSNAKPKAQFHSIDITGASYAKGFDLTDFNGKKRTLTDFKGDVVAIFFGYTHCPDVCPTTLSELAQVRHKLGSESGKFQVLFVSLDPARDTPTILKSYLGAFDKSFVALYPTPPGQLPKLAKNFKIFYEKVAGSTPGDYTLNHTAGTYFYDPEGRVRLFSPNDSPVADIVSDVKLLMQGA